MLDALVIGLDWVVCALVVAADGANYPLVLSPVYSPGIVHALCDDLISSQRLIGYAIRTFHATGLLAKMQCSLRLIL